MNTLNIRRKNGTARAFLPALLLGSLAVLLSVASYGQERRGFSDPDTSRVELRSGLYDLFAQKNSAHQTTIEGDNYGLDLRSQQDWGSMGLSATRDRFDFTQVNTATGLKFSLERNVQSLGIRYDRKMNWLGIGGKAVYLRTAEEQLCNYEVGASVSFQHGVDKNYELIYRRETLPFVVSASYGTEDLRIVDPASMSAVVQTVRYGYSSAVVSVGYSRWFPHGKGKESLYSLTNNSIVDAYSASLTSSGDRAEYRIDIQDLAFRTESDFVQRGMEFGFLNVDALNFLEVEASMARRYENGSALSLAARYYHAHGSLIGSLESWPFTTVVQSLFLNRIYFRAEGALDAQAIDASYAFTTGGVEIVPRCTLIRIAPALTVETWQPLLLAFGVSNYSKSELSFTEAGLCQFRIDAAFDAWGARFCVEGHQLIPVYSVSRKTAVSVPAPPSNGGNGSTSTDGGRWLRVTVGLPM